MWNSDESLFLSIAMFFFWTFFINLGLMRWRWRCKNSTTTSTQIALNWFQRITHFALNSIQRQRKKQRTLFRVRSWSFLCSFVRTFSLIIFPQFLPSSISFEGRNLLQRTRGVMATFRSTIFPKKNYMRITRLIWATNLAQPISLISLSGFWPVYPPREIRKKTISKFIF